MAYENMDRLIEGWRDAYIEALRRWVAIDSVAGAPDGPGRPFGKKNREMLDLALKDAREWGFETAIFDGYAGHVQLGAGDMTMGILAHLDVVPAGEGWTRDPFGGEIANGRLYGRGTSDDKGPALAALFAMRAVRDAGIPLKHGVRLILGCDEEVGMSDMRHYASVQKMPDYGFSPDASYPLINIEKGGLGIMLSGRGGDEDGARIPVYALSAGERVNVVPGTAEAEVGLGAMGLEALSRALEATGLNVTASSAGSGRARIVAHGVSAHAAMPDLGKNAAGMLLMALDQIGAGGGSKKLIAALAQKLGMEHDGRSLGIAASEEKSGALTCNLGLLRYDGTHLSARLDLRYPIGVDEQTMCGQMCMALSKTGLAVERLSGRPVHHVPAEDRVVRELLAAYHAVTGLEPYTMAIGGGTYSRMMPSTVAFGCTFPDEESCAHQPDEHIDIDRMMLSIRVMAHAIARLAGGAA